jgi:polysaccharide biosynthesis/export protein
MKTLKILVIELGMLKLLFCPILSFGDEKSKGSVQAETPQAPIEKVQTPDPRKQSNSDHPVLQRRNARYRLRYGDVIELKFPFTPEFDQKVTIHPDGYIPLTGLSDVHVEGLTEAELIESVRTAYSKILKNPNINVNLVEFEQPYFVVGGEVSAPGKFEMRGDMTVTQAVSIAGGFTDSAKHSQVWLFRRVSDEWVSTSLLDIKKMLKSGDLSEDPHLHPGDMVYVPKSLMGKLKPYLPRTDALIYMGIYASRGNTGKR